MNSKSIPALYNGEYTCIEKPIPKDQNIPKHYLNALIFKKN